MRALLILPLFATTLAVAQAPTPAPKRPPGPPKVQQMQDPNGPLVDMVIATINDSSILLTEVQTAAAGELRRRALERGGVSGNEVRETYRNQLDNLVQKHQLAQCAKTLGTVPPDQVEAYLRSDLERMKQEQVRDAGSYTELGRAFKDQGKTWQTVEREKRIDRLYDIARSLTVGARLQQPNLITPRMMREAYQGLKDHFQHPTRAFVTFVQFTGPDAATAAAQASTMWATRPVLTSREVAGKFAGSRSFPDLDAASLKAELAPVQAFALEGPEQRVSAPIATAEGLYVAKVTEYQAADNGQFEDPVVQERLRQVLDRMLTEQFLRDAQARADVRTEVWVSDQLGGKAPPRAGNPRR